MLNKLTIAEARDALRNRKFSAAELTEACLNAIEGAERLNVFVHKAPDTARQMAGDADMQLAQGDAPDLCGIPLGVSDVFCTKDVPSQAASRILDGFCPGYESTVTGNLWQSGAVMLGKLNLDEFGLGSSTQTSCYGPATNPWRGADGEQRSPGGAADGAAVAAGLCLAAAGADDSGSLRQSAVLTGMVGLKPTYGRVSRWGAISYTASLTQAGPVTRTVRDAAIMLRVMASSDDKDSTCADRPVEDYESALATGVRGKRIGLPREYRLDDMPADIVALWEKGAAMLRDAGAEIVDIALPHSKYALPAYSVIGPAEASSNLARYDGVRYGIRARLDAGDDITALYEKTRAEGFGPLVQRQIMLGTHLLSEGQYDPYFNRARKVRTLIQRDFDQVFDEGIDAILTPATLAAAVVAGDLPVDDPANLWHNDVFTVAANLAGLPALTLPIAHTDTGLPLGLQLIGRAWDEAGLLNCAQALETAAGFNTSLESWWQAEAAA